jgi:Rod binding domain-containing protein
MLAQLNPTHSSASAEGHGLEPRLVRAAHQFEALMMKELLAPMSRASLDDSKGEDTGVLGEFASESLAGGLSDRGGMGIADRILHDFSHPGGASAPGRIK